MRPSHVVPAAALVAIVATGFVARGAIPSVSIVTDAAPGRAAAHGIDALRNALGAQGQAVQVTTSLAAATGDRIVLAGLSTSGGDAVRALRAAGRRPPSKAEALVIARTTAGGKPALLLAGADDRGLMYAALDTANRIGWIAAGGDPLASIPDAEEQPVVLDRSLSVYTMNRAHWESRFYDERYWTRYLDMLASNRFNRFLIVFGYENGGFLAPPYPYFFDTPGFPDVHMVALSAADQHRNLEALNRLIEMAHDRGIAVGVGIWDHIYRGGVQTGGADWLRDYRDRPVPNTVTGVTSDNLNAYTLASIEALLKAVPALDSIQFRVHEESGLKPEEMEGFWRVVFQRVQQARPGILLEARAKGTPDSVINTALAQGVNLRVETKYWMEQMGLPFHPTHVNPPDQTNRRHGYADLLRYPQRYQINWRLWNGGTARVLLWADPDYVRRYSATTSLYDSPNWDVNEPLATKMEAQRPDAVPFDLMPAKYRYYDYEFERYWHFFQVWGRLGYNPETAADVWQREFRRRFGAAASDVEAAEHRASQVLPMIVSAVYPYRLFPMTRGWAERQSLGATLADYAKNESSDVQQFESFGDAARRIVAAGSTPRRTPAATSRWFDETADGILASVAKAEASIGDRRGPEFASTMTDARILAGLARFHARRSVAAVDYNLFTITSDPAALARAVAGERAAIEAWRGIVDTAGDRYDFNLAMGACAVNLCGHWRDELATLEKGFAQLQQEAARVPAAASPSIPARPAAPADTTPPVVTHTPVATAEAGQPLRIDARVTDRSGVESVRLRYRHVTQFDNYETLEMHPTGTTGQYEATVPGSAVASEWDFMYFIEAIDKAGNGVMWPDLAKQAPYVIVRVGRKSTSNRQNERTHR
jgi:hypothetical protein